jgi:hypothetical protein
LVAVPGGRTDLAHEVCSAPTTLSWARASRSWVVVGCSPVASCRARVVEVSAVAFWNVAAVRWPPARTACDSTAPPSSHSPRWTPWPAPTGSRTSGTAPTSSAAPAPTCSSGPVRHAAARAGRKTRSGSWTGPSPSIAPLRLHLDPLEVLADPVRERHLLQFGGSPSPFVRSATVAAPLPGVGSPCRLP